MTRPEEPARGPRPLVIARLSEQELPQARMTASPTPGALGNWTRPLPGQSAPASPGVGGTPGATPPQAAGPGQGATAGGAAASPQPGASPEAAEPETAPYELGTIRPIPQVSDVTLEPMIARASSPTLAVSLELAEQGRIELAAGNPDEALRSLGRAVSVDPENAYAYFYIGRAYFAKRNYAQALVFLRRAELGLHSDPDWLAEAKSFEGATLEELGRIAEAAAAYKQALEVAPNNLMARTGFGRIGSATAASAQATPAQVVPPPPPAPGPEIPPAPEQPPPEPAD